MENDRALGHNRSQRFNEAEIRVIQIAVGVDPKGTWDNETVEAVAQFQEQEGIEPDGMVRRDDVGKTWPVIKARAYEQTEVMDYFDLGMRVDDEPKTVLETDFLEDSKKLGIWNLALPVNKPNTRDDQAPWELDWSISDIASVAAMAATMEMTITLTVWPRPSEDQMNMMFTALGPLANLPGLVAIEVATEGNWDKRYLQGFPDMYRAGQRLATRMHEFARDSGARLELTATPVHVESGPNATVAKFMDTVTVQAYSVRTRKRAGEDWNVPWGHMCYSPGRMQEWALRRAASIIGAPTLACGIAMWDQEWPDRLPSVAMYKAMRTAAACGAQELRLCSSKWIVGSHAQEECVNRLRRLR